MPRFHTGVSLGNVEFVTRSEKAILVESENLPSDFWVPISQIHEDTEIWEDSSPGEEGGLVVTEWWAEQKGLA